MQQISAEPIFREQLILPVLEVPVGFIGGAGTATRCLG